MLTKSTLSGMLFKNKMANKFETMNLARRVIKIRIKIITKLIIIIIKSIITCLMSIKIRLYYKVVKMEGHKKTLD